MKDKAA